MGQPDLTLNKLISHPDIFADIINVIVYEGERVLEEKNLRPFYMNANAAKDSGKLRGLYRDTCMEDVRDGIRYIIWGIENQYVQDLTTPVKIMGYDYTAYDRQIEELVAQNKKDGAEAYVSGLMPGQKLKPVVTIVLYYGTDDMPDSLCAMIDMPDNKAVRKYIQDYKLNLIRLRELTKEQIELLYSDFAYIAKFMSKAYNKEERLKVLRDENMVMLHTKDTLLALTAVTKDKRYLGLGENRKEESKVCEVLDLLVSESVGKGKAEGKAESIVELLEDVGMPSAALRKRIMSQTQPDILKKWLRAAKKAESVEEFEGMMNA